MVCFRVVYSRFLGLVFEISYNLMAANSVPRTDTEAAALRKAFKMPVCGTAQAAFLSV